MTHYSHRTDLFSSKNYADKKPLLVVMAWAIVRVLFFLSPLPWPSALKASLLRIFGAKIGSSLYIRPRVYIHFPWKIQIGDHCWIGERCEIYNFEMVTMEDYSALAHDVFLAAASHDIRSISLKYKNRPITIEKGVWIASRAFIHGGVTIGEGSIVGAGCIVSSSIEPRTILKPPEPIVYSTRIIDRP